MSYSLVQISEPETEPISLLDAKRFASLDASYTDDDALLTGLITAARQASEAYLNRSIYTQQWRLGLTRFPWLWNYSNVQNHDESGWPYDWIFDAQTIRLPRPTCISVDQISYSDQNGITQLLDPSSYYVSTDDEPARIVPFPGSFWPTAANYLPSNIKITFSSSSFGDGLIVDNCPQTIKVAISMLTAFWYTHREGAVDTPAAFFTLLNPYRFVTFGYSR